MVRKLLSSLALVAAAAWPIADVAAANGLSELDWTEALPWFGAILTGLIVSAAAVRFLVGSFVRAAAVVAPLGMFFFAYATAAPALQVLSDQFLIKVGAFSLYVVIFLLMLFWLFRASRAARVAQVLLWVPPAFLASTVVFIGIASLTLSRASSQQPPVFQFNRRPNVYHFLFDGMGRKEVIASALKLDVGNPDSDFEALGFIVPLNVTAQYATTWQSISSFLNMGRSTGKMEIPDIAASSVIQVFRKNNYEFARYGEVFRFASCTGQEDVCLSGASLSLSEFSIAMIKRTPMFTIGRRWILSSTSSRRLQQNLRRVAAFQPEKPSFVFIYMVPPHPPFIFSDDCKANKEGFDDFRAWQRSSAPRYAIAYRCVVKAATLEIRRIIANDPSAIIIVSGDHGTMFGQIGAWEKDGWTPGVMAERLPTFLAIRAPAACSKKIREIRKLSETYGTIFDCLRRVPPA